MQIVNHVHQNKILSDEAHRELLGKQITAMLLEIAELEGGTIPHMKVDENGIFRPIDPELETEKTAEIPR